VKRSFRCSGILSIPPSMNRRLYRRGISIALGWAIFGPSHGASSRRKPPHRRTRSHPQKEDSATLTAKKPQPPAKGYHRLAGWASPQFQDMSK
jgi:hypothetical protein